MNGKDEEEQIALYLAERTYLYRLFHAVFGAETDEALLQEIGDEQTESALAFARGLLGREELEAVASQKACGEESVADALGKSEDLLHAGSLEAGDLKDDYERLFEIPGKRYVRPWESTYIDDQPTVFKQSTLEVRSYYHDAGLKLEAEKRFPDDHIAAMMDFMAHESEAAYEAFAEGDDERTASILENQMAFARNHLLNWVGEFAAEVAEKDERGFFGSAAQVMAAWSALDLACVRRVFGLIVP